MNQPNTVQLFRGSAGCYADAVWGIKHDERKAYRSVTQLPRIASEVSVSPIYNTAATKNRAFKCSLLFVRLDSTFHYISWNDILYLCTVVSKVYHTLPYNISGRFRSPLPSINQTTTTLELVRLQVLTAASMKVTVFWDVAPCSLVEVACDSKLLWKVGRLLWDYATQHPRKQSSS
jgi:hypothetical protein